MDYISVENQKALSQRYKTAVIMVFAFSVSVIISMFVANLISPGQPIPGSERWARPIFGGVILMGLIVVVLRRFLMSQMVMGQVSSRGTQTVLNSLMTMTIICLAIAEAVGIFGLVFYLLTGDYQYSWRLGVVSILLLLYSFPRRGEWERAIIASAKAQADSPSAARRAAQ